MTVKKDVFVCDLAKSHPTYGDLCGYKRKRCEYAWGVCKEHETVATNGASGGFWVDNVGHYSGRCPYNTVVKLVPKGSYNVVS